MNTNKFAKIHFVNANREELLSIGVRYYQLSAFIVWFHENQSRLNARLEKLDIGLRVVCADAEAEELASNGLSTSIILVAHLQFYNA